VLCRAPHNTHARRQFVDVASSFPDACCHVIEVFAEVYRIDHETKDLGMSDAARLEHHRTHSRPLMVALKKWMRKLLADHEVEPNSGLGKAMRYMIKHWMGLTLFYRKAGVPLDNNLAERILKKAIIYPVRGKPRRSGRGQERSDARR
jgi:transposase